MRTDQHIGLTVAARNFLKSVGINHKKVISTYSGMFGDKYPLYRYYLGNGCYADEYLQTDPWSSGPMFFIGLRVSGFEWAEAEIQEYLK